MKKIFLIFLLLIAHCTLKIEDCKCQFPHQNYWQPVQSPLQSNINSVLSISGSNIYAVGNNGLFLYSYNDGYKFSQMPGLKTVNFNSIGFMVSPPYFFNIVGEHGIIYKFTENLPAIPTIVIEESGTTANLYSIVCSRVSIVPILINRFAVGANGTLIKSTFLYPGPGTWSNWTPISSGTSQNLYSIGFNINYNGNTNVNPIGCIVGNNGIILRTSNNGDNWSIINSGVTNKLNYICFYDSATCWVTGSNGLLMKSTNSGLNWIIVPLGTTSDLKSFSFNPFSICGSGGTIFFSSNYGINWTISQTPSPKNLNSIAYPIVVGDSGTILRMSRDSSYLFKKLEGNNIRSFILNTGIFDQDKRTPNTPGLEWPKGSDKFAGFTAGLSIAALYQGQLREASASYIGEYYPGICNNGIAQTNDTFRLYSIKRGYNTPADTDWTYWGLMVPYGAPFIDVNNNGIYDPQIDTPGVKGASQTIFECYTDGFPQYHNPVEGFGGGTAPLYSEVHLTAWCYSQLSYADMQFIKFVIINKGIQPWTRTYFSLVSDPDLGYPNDDYIGCDTIRDLAFCYNSNNNDPTYGSAPPAVGFLLLKGPYNKYSNPPKQIDMTSFIGFWGPSSHPISCENDPNPDALGAYWYIQGFKKDSTCWLDPTQLVAPPNYYKKTKFIYPGDPETNTGWTEIKGYIGNCNRDSSGSVNIPTPWADQRLAFGSGADNFTVMPGDTQTIVICQLIARGSNNLNSVTKLKQLADVAWQFYNSGFTIGINKISEEVPTTFRLEQNYPNPFNPVTKIHFNIAPLLRGVNEARGVLTTLKVYDILGREIQTLVNEKLHPGTYEVTFDGRNFASGIYFYQLKSGDFIETKKMLMIK